MSICQIYDLCAETLWLGRYGENGARDIAIDVGKWFSDLGTEGTVVLVNWRPGEDDTPYNPNVTMDGSRVVWSPSNVDLAISGRGFAELRYYVGNALAKSKTFRTVIDRTPSEGADPPSAAEDWLERMEDAAVTAQTASETAVAAAETATEGAQAVAQALPTITQAAQTATSAAATATSAATEAALSEEVASAAANAAQTASETATAASQTAVSASGTATTKASQASASASTAATAATTATNKASEATTAATTATTKAGEASTSASTAVSAKDTAVSASQTATSKASEATTAAATATSAKTDAVAANTAAQSAKTAAQTAQTGAETAAASVSASAAQIATNAEDISQLKSDLIEIKPIVTEEVASTNVFTPISTRIYPDGGTAVINDDKSMTITDVPRLSNVWIYAQGDTAITLEAGEYTLCLDEGLFVYGTNTVSFQTNAGGLYADIVTATGKETSFNIPNDITAKFRIQYVATGSYTTNWNGHIWINKGEAQPYMPVGVREILPKEFVDAVQGEENSGKILSVNDDGKVSLIENPLGTVVSDELYKKGNLLEWDDITKGYIKADGTVQPYNSLWCSDFCEIEAGKVYCNAVSGNINVNQYFAFYDENKTFLASYQTIGSMQRLTSDIRYLTVPEGAKYFRCTFSVDQAVNRTAWISNSPENPYEKDSYNVKDVYPYAVNPENPCDYSELTVRAFSKVVCIGDSLTYGGFNLSNSGSATGETQSSAELALRYSYPSNFQRITGVETVNAGDSGETSVSWYQQHQNDDFSQFDLAIIHLGVNDSAFSVSDADTLTAMQNIVTMLNNARSDMRIAICSVIPAYDGTGYQAKGQLILNWAKGLSNPNIIPLDIARYSHARPRTSYVAGHLSALGYYMMAYDIARYISWYMDQNQRDFRFIHFIGSPDAVYDYD